ncbi:MAG: hypothetical protein WCV93_00515 [Candidatus Shapirobacteria bacterium]|jgi:hypothetical protein
MKIKDKTKELLTEAKRLEEKIKKLDEKYQELEMDNEDTWGGHDGPMALGYENERKLWEAQLKEIALELEKMGYQDKIG